MRILVIGRSGQLARAVAQAPLPDPDWQIATLGRPDLDITDPASVRAAISGTAPDIVVNTAAHTAVDQAESEPRAAFAVNRDGARNVAVAAAEAGVPVIHVSTDYVFSGEIVRPLRETDAVGPLNVYGRSKRAGEEAVAQSNPRHAIVRTSWLHAPWGRNFATTMLRLAAERDRLSIVGDQTGTPTYAPDLADAILSLAGAVVAMPDDSDRWGVYHLTNAGATTWHDFAAEVFRVAGELGRRPPELRRISTSEYPTPAARPRYTVLDNSKIATAFDIRLRDWRSAAGQCVRRMLTEI